MSILIGFIGKLINVYLIRNNYLFVFYMFYCNTSLYMKHMTCYVQRMNADVVKTSLAVGKNNHSAVGWLTMTVEPVMESHLPHNNTFWAIKQS